jgi:predicted Zn finger-like uncharacterized protein
MEVQCPQCQSKIAIPDERIPAGKLAAFACPRCKQRITARAPAAAPALREEPRASAPSPAAPPAPAPAPADEGDFMLDPYDADEKPFDFIEEEVKTALVCENDPALNQKICEGLRLMEFHVTDAPSVRDALKKMRYHNFDLIVVDEHFGRAQAESNGVLIYAERLPMTIRRNTFVTLISHRHRTMDDMMAFQHSVNLIVNARNIDQFEKVLSRSMGENSFIYRIYKDLARDTGI